MVVRKLAKFNFVHGANVIRLRLQGRKVCAVPFALSKARPEQVAGEQRVFLHSSAERVFSLSLSFFSPTLSPLAGRL